jgi:PelA/Pel-15E family pectate lyase
VGQALLTAFSRTGEAYLLASARDAAGVLVRGQLQSGGWDYRIELEPKDRAKYAYRSDNSQSGRNWTTLDDDTTQAALRFLMLLDRQLRWEDESIHSAATFALDCLLKAQYPIGAWPQRYRQFPDPDKFPVRRAGYPDTWSRTFTGRDYRGDYTLNDNTLADMITTMLTAAEVYRESRYREAAKRAGEFLLLAQMPEPQPAWAQQYNAQMFPAWARRFEPPSVTGGESQGAIRVLMDLYRQTGEKRYLQPIPRALDYLQASALPNGRLARFYELKTNKPLYFTKTYQLTYSDDDMPTHYSFQAGSSLDSLRAQYEDLGRRSTHQSTGETARRRLTSSLRAQALAVVQTMDERGAWVESGRLRSHDDTRRVIDCRTFCRNVDLLSQFIALAD